MKFSIIIPAYNAEHHFRKALDSVKSQTFKDYELIVVCDSCIDNTEKIAREEYGATTWIVRYHNDGLSRSKGLDVANGDWVLFMDDDDWWLHEYVLEQLDSRVGREKEDILAFSFIFKGVRYASPYSCGGGLYPAVWNKCWRREFIGNTRFPSIHSCSDYEFHVAMMRKHPKIVAWDMPMYYYNYMRTGSITQIDAAKKQGV